MPEYDVVLHDGEAGELTLEGRPADPDDMILLQKCEGLDARELREEVLDLPDRDGDYLGGVRQAGVVLILTGKIAGPNRAGMRAREADLRRALVASAATWPLRVAGRAGDPEDMTLQVRTSSPFRSVDTSEDGVQVKEWQVAVRAADSVFYGADELTASILPIIGLGGLPLPLVFPLDMGAGAATPGDAVVNAGDADSWPVLRVYGPITQPRLENLTSGLSVVFTGSLLDGEFIEVDTATGSVLYNSGASAYATVDRAASSFWPLPPGTSMVRLRASAFTTPARLVVTWRNAYL